MRLDGLAFPFLGVGVQRILLKSKLHRAVITKADVEYEGSIEIPLDLLERAGIWEGERVLVTSATSGARLETYVQAGEPGTGEIIMNGGAAHLIKAGEFVTIMAFAVSDTPILAKRLVMTPQNEVLRQS